MNLSIDKVNDVSIITIAAPSLDASNNRAFVDQVTPLLRAGGNVLFDMSALRFVDSSALGSMMVCLRRLKDAGGHLKLCGLSKPVLALFELVRMHRIFDIYATKDEAIQTFLEGVKGEG